MRQFPTAPLTAASRLLLTALLASSCDGGTEPPPTPTKLVLVTEPSAAAETMVRLGTQPVVQATDASGQAAPTATTVTAEVVGGSGAVAAGGSAATNASGRATFSDLTLGAADGLAGPLTLRFSAPGLDPVTAAVDLRCAVLPLAIGQTVDRALTTRDCAFLGGALHNIFEVTTSQPVTAVRLTQDGTFRPTVQVRGPNEPDYYWGWVASPFGSDNRISYKALLPPGRNRVAVASADPGQTGSYSLTVAAAPEDLTCESPAAFAASPITTAQQLGAGDCSDGSFYVDRLVVGLPPNASISASMTSGAFQPHIRLLDATTDKVATSATAEGTARLTFANGSGIPKAYLILLTSHASGGTGPYTLSLNITYPPRGAATAAAATRLPPVDGQVLRRADGGPAGLAGPFSAAWSRPWP